MQGGGIRESDQSSAGLPTTACLDNVLVSAGQDLVQLEGTSHTQPHNVPTIPFVDVEDEPKAVLPDTTLGVGTM